MFALIVVNYGSCHLLEQNLAKETLTAHGRAVVVVDNYTSDRERRNVSELAEAQGWQCVLLDTNRGFGAGVNAGARCALENGAEVITVLNPDAHIAEADLERMVSAVVADPNLMVSPVIKTSAGSIWFDGMYLYLDSGRVASDRRRIQPTGPREYWISGACFAVSRHMWELLGGFDEDYFLYWEDVDLSKRCVQLGGKLVVLADAYAVHDPGGTQTPTGEAGTKSETYYFHNIRNRMVYAAKHLDDKGVRQWLRSTPRVSYEILLAGGHRQFLRSPAPLRAYFGGMLRGWQMLVEIRKQRRLKVQ